MGNEVKKCMGVEKLTDNRFLNLYHIDARSASGQPFDYYFASRNDADNIKIKTKEVRPEGIVIYPVLKDEPDKVVMIRCTVIRSTRISMNFLPDVSIRARRRK